MVVLGLPRVILASCSSRVILAFLGETIFDQFFIIIILIVSKNAYEYILELRRECNKRTKCLNLILL